ncbi:ATP-dependent nuclease [Yersinia enterocolitica]
MLINQSIANFLLIEEPEAHIHTHIQKSLFDNISYENTQIIYSTHSSHISEVSNISNMNIIGFVDGVCEVFQPAAGLIEQKVGFVQRYLDAIRSNLLFARSVVLVEGDAEEFLIPILLKKVLGLSLDEIGVTLVNIRSTGFENIAMLFDNERIKKRCSIITDLDKAFFDTTIFPTDSDQDKKKKGKAIGSQETGFARKVRLDVFCQNNPWISTFYAENTFEVDFIKSSNSNYLEKIVGDVYTQQATINTAKSELSSTDIGISGSRALTMANYQGKGWFALNLGKVIDFKVTIPEYIFDAIKFAHGDFNKALIFKILKHRYYSIIEHVAFGKETIERLNVEGNVALKQEWETYLTPYVSGLARFTPKWEAFSPVDGDIDALKVDLMGDLPYEKNGILTRI